MDNLIEARNLSVRYRQKTAVDDIGFTMPLPPRLKP